MSINNDLVFNEIPFAKTLINESISYGIVQPGAERVENSVPVIRVNNFENGKINTNNIKRVASEIEKKYSKTRLKGGELLITVVGTVGATAIATDEMNGWNVARAVSVAKIKESYNVKYIKYCFKNRDVIHQIYGSTNDTVQATLNLSLLKKIILSIPNRVHQDLIVNFLNAFDDKIELLQAQNKTLETMAQTIFKEWFGKYQIGDELPEGWKVGNIYNVLDVQYGYPFKSKLFNENKEGLPLIRIRDIRKGVTGFYTTESYEEEFIISSGDVLAGMDAIFQPYLWSGGKGLLNQRACRFIPKDFVSRIFVFEFMKPHLSFYEKTKVGTTVIHLGKGDLDFIETVIPDKESLLKFKELSTPIEEKIINNQQEIQSLIKTRDTLLPKLMSGQVRVKNLKQTAYA